MPIKLFNKTSTVLVGAAFLFYLEDNENKTFLFYVLPVKPEFLVNFIPRVIKK